jgi:thiamine pyrophosphokinase
MIINILGGGPVDLLTDLNHYNEEESLWVGVDRGVFTLINKGIQPNIAFGDFDSVSSQEFKQIEYKVKHLEKFKPEKDETDMELALNWALEQKPDQIHIFGASGGRLDHFFANVQLLISPVISQTKTEICLIDRKNILFVKAAGKYEIKKIPDKKYISFVPVSFNIKDLTLEGFKYPLQDSHISIGSTLCISNELIRDYGTFSFSEGILIVVRSCD